MDIDEESTVLTNMDTTLEGTVEGSTFHMTNIECSGEGSGIVMLDVLEPAFKHSTGHLVLSRIWEGGESIDKLEVHNGLLVQTEIEL